MNIKEGTLVFVWDDGYLGDSKRGNIIRKYIKKDEYGHLVRMYNGRSYNYNNAIPVSMIKCPRCGKLYRNNVSDLVIGREALDENGEHFISHGYVGACLDCDKDFFLSEMV